MQVREVNSGAVKREAREEILSSSLNEQPYLKDHVAVILPATGWRPIATAVH